MMEEAEDEIGSLANPRESAISLFPNLRLGLRRAPLHPILDIPVTVFLGVQVRGIPRQPLHDDLGMLGQERLDHLGTVGLQSIPDDDHRPTDLAPQMLQVRDRILAVDRVVEMLLVDVTRGRQADGRGDLASLADPPQHRRPPLGSPCLARLDLEREAGLVHEDDHGAPAASFFLMRGQSRSSQARINSSSRSAARTAGTWAVQPRSLSRVER